MEYKIHEIKHSSSNEEFEKIMNIYGSEGYEYVGNITLNKPLDDVSKLIFTLTSSSLFQ